MSQPQLSTVELLTTLKHAFSTNTQYSTVTLSPKRANSQLASVSIMNDTKPTAAGEDPTTLKPKQTPPVLPTQPSQDINQSPIVNQQQRPTPSSLQMKKIAVVLSRAVRAAMNGNQGYTPYNVGINAKMPTPGAAQIPMPIGYQQPQAQAQPQQPQAPQQPAVPAAGPSANPINSYGPISVNGDINGNAAFGQKNSPDSMKAAGLSIYKQAIGPPGNYAPMPTTPQNVNAPGALSFDYARDVGAMSTYKVPGVPKNPTPETYPAEQAYKRFVSAGKFGPRQKPNAFQSFVGQTHKVPPTFTPPTPAFPTPAATPAPATLTQPTPPVPTPAPVPPATPPTLAKAAELTWMIPGTANFHNALETALNLKKWGVGTEKKSVALDIYEKRVSSQRV